MNLHDAIAGCATRNDLAEALGVDVEKGGDPSDAFNNKPDKMPEELWKAIGDAVEALWQLDLQYHELYDCSTPDWLEALAVKTIE